MLKGKTAIVVAIGLGLLAAAFAWMAVRRANEEARKGFVPSPVLVAAMDVPPGTELTTEHVAQRMIPEQFVTTSLVKPENVSYVIGQKVLVPLQAGDVILWTQFETSKAAERLSTLVSKTARAYTVDTTGSKMNIGGWLRPNDLVDIVGTFQDPSTGTQIATTIMEKVLVIATGNITGTTNLNLLPENKRSFNSVTLLLLPEEVEAIALASEVGNLSFSLRNEQDYGTLDFRGHTSLATLLTGVRMRELGKIRSDTITVIRGNKSTND